MSLALSQLYEFGAFRLDARQKALWREGQLVPLTPKLVETLLVLVEAGGQIVDKQELMERVWPDTFVEEGNVTRHVSLLRKALAEWPQGTELIETLPRRGYRFIAPVRQLPALRVAEPLPGDPGTAEQELILETHTITRITAEETFEEDGTAEWTPTVLPALPPVTALATRKSWRRFWRYGATVVLVIAIMLGGFWWEARSGLALTEKDTLLLAEFVNRTGDPVFDGTLRQGLAVQLEQSPFLNFLSDQRVRETLKLMTRSPEERITPEIAREICLRQGLKAMILGEITPLGQHYAITLTALAGQDGTTLARAQSEADAKEQVLRALSQAASSLRQQLGESLVSLQKYDALLEQTTASLPALQNLMLGLRLNRQGQPLEALPYLQRAVELDPNFASAWATRAALLQNTQQFEAAAESAARAYALREHASEKERYRIEMWYHQFTTHDLLKSIEVLEQFRRTYPREAVAYNTLSRVYTELGQFEQAEAPAREAIPLNPAATILPENLAEVLLRLNRLAESKDILTELKNTSALTARSRALFFQLACLDENEAAQQREIAAFQGQSDEYRSWQWLAERAAYHGQTQQARAALRQAVELAARPQLRGEAASLLGASAINLALLCSDNPGKQPCDIRELTQQALALERNDFTMTRSMLALALNGRETEALALATELHQQYPQGTLLNAVWLPLLRALQALYSQQPAQAIEQLRAADHYEAAAHFYPQYVRGLAWLQLKSGPEAAAEFEKIRAHRSYDPVSPLYPLAHLGLARAATLQGDHQKSRLMYQEFFKLWQKADNLAVMNIAKQEFAQLR